MHDETRRKVYAGSQIEPQKGAVRICFVCDPWVGCEQASFLMGGHGPAREGLEFPYAIRRPSARRRRIILFDRHPGVIAGSFGTCASPR